MIGLMEKEHSIKTQFENNNYVRKANTPNHWVDFSYRKLKGFINNFGDDFNLVIYWYNNDSVSFYSIPYIFLKRFLLRVLLTGEEDGCFQSQKAVYYIFIKVEKHSI